MLPDKFKKVNGLPIARFKNVEVVLDQHKLPSFMIRKAFDMGFKLCNMGNHGASEFYSNRLIRVVNEELTIRMEEEFEEMLRKAEASQEEVVEKPAVKKSLFKRLLGS